MEDLASALRILQVALGIGMVIFIHEAGHFIAARLCGVRVDVFSLGFGPRLIGWRRGPTMYQVAAVPLGGYVKMKGEEGFAAGSRPDSDDLQSKTVGQRFFIYSAGVIMNLLLGIVVFPLIFAHGVLFTQPLVGEIVPGSPAWEAGLEPGEEVLAVDDVEVFEWFHIAQAIALSDEDGAKLTLRNPDTGDVRHVVVEPRYDERLGLATIGIDSPVDPDGALFVLEDSPAWRAGQRADDRLLEVEGGLPGIGLYLQFRDALRSSETVRVRVQSADTGTERWLAIEPELEPGKTPLLGVRALVNRVAAMSLAPGLAALGLREDDRLLAVAGRPIYREGDLRRALLDASGEIVFEVQRGEERRRLSTPPLSSEEALALTDGIAVVADAQGTRVAVNAGGAARRAGMRDGDRIRSIAGVEVADWDGIIEGARRAAGLDGPAEVRVARGTVEAELGASEEALAFQVEPALMETPYYGVAFKPATYIFQADGVWNSFQVGVTCSWRMVQDLWLTLKKMLLGKVSSKNLGGIITISKISYGLSEQGMAKLLFFLCMLSINLAFLNVLPIPVLDGGHLFFLIVEKIKGSPVSERVMGYSQMVGLVLILSLMVYVTFNDIQRWFFPGG